MRQKIKDLFKKIAGLEDPDEKIALAFAIGVFLGIAPLIGIHTFTAILAAFVFRLNKVAVLSGAWGITNPYTFIPIYSFSTWVGMKVLGTGFEGAVDFNMITWGSLMGSLKIIALPFILGSFIVGAAVGGIMYLPVLYVVRILRKRDKEVTVQTSNLQQTPRT